MAMHDEAGLWRVPQACYGLKRKRPPRGVAVCSALSGWAVWLGWPYAIHTAGKGRRSMLANQAFRTRLATVFIGLILKLWDVIR